LGVNKCGKLFDQPNNCLVLMRGSAARINWPMVWIRHEYVIRRSMTDCPLAQASGSTPLWVHVVTANILKTLTLFQILVVCSRVSNKLRCTEHVEGSGIPRGVVWGGSTPPPISLPSTEFVDSPPPPNKIPGFATG
jgi:hypothetical protein